jgi:endonuclease G, mitochondrial
MKNSILALSLLLTGVCFAQQAAPHADCSAQIPYGKPILKSEGVSDPVVCRTAYVLQYDDATKVPLWDAHVLTPEHAYGCIARTNAFASDKSLGDESSKPSDYAHSGYDIGHISPDADMAWDPTVERESFILTNMAPQLPGFNRGIWKVLEVDVRAWAWERKHPLLVYAGSIVEDSDTNIGTDKVAVPREFYKIIIDENTKEYLAFLFPHKEGLGADVTPYITTLTDIQGKTGIIFPLPEGAMERHVLWPVDVGEYNAAKKAGCHGGTE